MDPINPQPNNPKPNWFLSHKFLYSVIGILFLIVIAGIAYWAKIQKDTAKTLEQANSYHAPTHRSGQSEVPSDWKTYTNEQYGFEFKYPSSWDFMSGPTSYGKTNGVLIEGTGAAPGQVEFDIEIFDMKAEEKLSDAFQRITTIDPTTLKDKIITVNEIPAILYQDVPGNFHYNEVVVSKNNNFYGLMQFTDDQTFNQILSTFKFIEPLAINQCSINNVNEKIDQKTIDALNIAEIKKYTDLGYTLRHLCSSSGKLLLFFDFSDGYWKSVANTNSQELADLQTRLIIGLIDTQSKTSQFYKLDWQYYRLEGPGGSDCSFDKFTDNKILYICVDGNESGGVTNWFAYDLSLNKNITVKYEFKDFTPDAPKNDDIKVYSADLLKLFSIFPSR